MTALRWVLGMVVYIAFGAPCLGDQSPYSVPPDCYQYFKDACSPKIGAWLPRVPGEPAWFSEAHTNPTTAHDEIGDDAGNKKSTLERSTGPKNGTPFVYGMAGPPRGTLVYDPAARIAYYDVGCCAWHDVVVSIARSPPPKTVVERSLRALRTHRGIALGVTPQAVRVVFGPAALTAVSGHANEGTLEYAEPLHGASVSSTCVESYAFLFASGRLAAIDYGAAC
jgi:hypothetical protein